MTSQQAIWDDEYRQGRLLPSSTSAVPSRSVVRFCEYLHACKALRNDGCTVDIGCGKGRNSFYLAERGQNVYGLDFSTTALSAAREQAEGMGIDDRLNLIYARIDRRWPYDDAMFDVALDVYSSMNLPSRTGRAVARRELWRTLRPGGYALVAVVAADDAMEVALARTSPGPEPHSTLWPGGKFQKSYSREEIVDLYCAFEIKKILSVRQQTSKLGREYLGSDYWIILRKAATPFSEQDLPAPFFSSTS